MRMSAYYCDICGSPSSGADLKGLLLRSNDTILRNYSGVCQKCLAAVDLAASRSDIADEMKDKADG